MEIRKGGKGAVRLPKVPVLLIVGENADVKQCLPMNGEGGRGNVDGAPPHQ